MNKKLLTMIAGLCVTSNASAVDYFNVKITGIGISTAGNYVRFTIDQDPNVILTTDAFDPEQAKHLTALIIAAYTAQSPVYYVRSSETAPASGRRYTSVNFVSLGTRTWD